jgi:hypothetical protein
MLVIAVLVVSAVMIVWLDTGESDTGVGGDVGVNCLEFFAVFGGKAVFVIGLLAGSVFCGVNS